MNKTRQLALILALLISMPALKARAQSNTDLAIAARESAREAEGLVSDVKAREAYLVLLRERLLPVAGTRTVGTSVSDRLVTLDLFAGSIYTDPRLIANLRAEYQPFVVGGEDLRPGQGGDSCVAVGGAGGYCCSGTLIAPNLVLTAGHCVDGPCGRLDKVYIGHSILDGTGTVLMASNVIRHPGYSKVGEHTRDDIALMFLTEAASVDPATAVSGGWLDRARSIHVAGFGYGDYQATIGRGVRRIGKDILVASTSCSDVMDPYLYGCNKGLEFVAEDREHRVDACRADSGGPAFLEHDGTYVLAGVISRGTRKGKRPCGDGGIYQRVDKYWPWILETATARKIDVPPLL